MLDRAREIRKTRKIANKTEGSLLISKLLNIDVNFIDELEFKDTLKVRYLDIYEDED